MFLKLQISRIDMKIGTLVEAERCHSNHSELRYSNHSELRSSLRSSIVTPHFEVNSCANSCATSDWPLWPPHETNETTSETDSDIHIPYEKPKRTDCALQHVMPGIESRCRTCPSTEDTRSTIDNVVQAGFHDLRRIMEEEISILAKRLERTCHEGM